MEYGHQAEEYLLMACSQIGIRVVDHDLVGKDPGSPAAITRSTDWEDAAGWDFWFYFRGEWVKIDLTTARDPEVLDRKNKKGVEENIFIVVLPGRTIRFAAQGCRRDLSTVAGAFWGIAREMAGRKQA
ncbi:MAG: hypothetical protein ABIJ36_02670 [Patescibacteria group bacterium]